MTNDKTRKLVNRIKRNKVFYYLEGWDPWEHLDASYPRIRAIELHAYQSFRIAGSRKTLHFRLGKNFYISCETKYVFTNLSKAKEALKKRIKYNRNCFAAEANSCKALAKAANKRLKKLTGL